MHLKEQTFFSPLLSRAHPKKFIRSLDKHIHWHHLLRKKTEWQNTCLGHTKSWVQSVVKEKKEVRSAQGRSVVPLRITDIKFGGGVWVENRHTFKSPLHCTQIFVLWNSDTVKLTLGTYRLTYFNISIDSTTPKKSFLLYFCLFCVGGGDVTQHACGPQKTTSHHSGGPWDRSDHHA